MIEGVEFIGRFHPVLLHLPIGIFIFVFGLEILGRIKKESNYADAISMGLLLGLLSSIATCISGLLLANGGDYEGELVEQHKWMGIGMTVAAALLYYLNYKASRGSENKLYLPIFSVFMLLLTITGHKGGSITHGEGFLWSDPEPTTEVAFENINEVNAYEGIITPILKAKCFSCHNTSKSKGKLIMTSPEELMQGGETGPSLVAGDVSESLMMTRIHLPMEEKEHMPPKSKKQLTDDEVTLLEWWISEGATITALVGEIKQSDAVATILSKYAVAKDAYEQLNVKPADDNVLASLVSAGVPAATLAINNPFVEVNLSHKQNLSKSLINKLSKVKKQLSILDLGWSNADDQMLSNIDDYIHLRNLQLQKTKITDKTIARIKGLSHLKILNLYGSQVTDDIIPIIADMPSLNTVYLLETAVSDTAIAQLKKMRPLMEVNHSYNMDVFGDAALKAPLIISERDFFKDSLAVELKLNYKNVNLHYTLDGSDPDTTSAIYTEPIVLTKTTMLKVISAKKGWKSSNIASRQFVQSTYDIASIDLTTQPATKYKAKGASTLHDLRKGTTAFTEGSWLGYEGQHLKAVIDLGKKEEISNVTISALDASGSWIFFPRGMKIWTSEDGSNYTLKKEASYPGNNNISTPSTSNFSEDIGLTSARYIKLEVQSQLQNPDWHPNPGGKSWLFVDEVHVN